MTTGGARIGLVGLLGLALIAGACRTPRAPSPAKVAPPALVVLLVVDQMRADYLDRFDAEWRGGFRRILDGGHRYTAAYNDFAITETACGHATLASGRFPRSTGVAGNKWYDRTAGRVVESVDDPGHPLLGSPGVGRSGARFRGGSLGSWLRAARPGSRVVSVARKDRSAIWLAGGSGDQVYWYDPKTRRATSSTAFRDSLPPWVDAFNREHDVRDWAGRVWNSELAPDHAYPGVREDDFESENAGRMGRTFPHALPSDPEAATALATLTPWMDDWVLDLARAAIAGQDLGGDEVPDLLLVSLGATDEIGHLFGPYSVEMAAQLLRLDLLLGAFLDDLDRRVGHDRVLVALASDHGVAPVPLQSVRLGRPHARYIDMEELRGRIRRRLEEKYGTGDYVPGVRPLRLWFDHALLAARGIDLAAALSIGRQEALATPGVARVLTEREMAPPPAPREEGETDRILEQARRSYVPDLVGDLLIVSEPYCVTSDPVDATTHISPHDYDTHVPLILFGAGIEPARDDRRVSTVDLAPTLAAILGVDPAEALDGRLLPGFGG